MHKYLSRAKDAFFLWSLLVIILLKTKGNIKQTGR